MFVFVDPVFLGSQHYATAVLALAVDTAAGRVGAAAAAAAVGRPVVGRVNLAPFSKRSHTTVRCRCRRRVSEGIERAAIAPAPAAALAVTTAALAEEGVAPSPPSLPLLM